MNSQGQDPLSIADRAAADFLLKLGLFSPQQVEEAFLFQASSGHRLTQSLIRLGYANATQLQSALCHALGLGEENLVAPRIGEVLVGLEYLSQEQVDEALKLQKIDSRRLGEILLEGGQCNHKQLYEALSLQQRLSTRGAPVEEAKDPLAQSKVRVLVVDDSPLACGVVKEGLEQHGFEVICFQDPFQALEETQRLKPAILLTDLEMPHLDGAEVCRRIKAVNHGLPVIILTASDEDELKVSGLRAGADDYVNKGASMAELAARIEGILRRSGETQKMRSLFARYTSEQVVDEILKSGEVVLHGEKREVTALFADIRNFTGLAESLAAEEVVDILNRVLGRLADAVLTCGGTLDKFLGDGLMAVFGAPVSHPDDALRAVQAAQMMMSAVEQVNAEGRAAVAAGRLAVPPPEIRLGIGINTGLAVVGNVGSSARTEYTCIGDAVNVAARLCSKAGPMEIWVGERTQELVGQAGRFEALPEVQLKGKRSMVPVFRAAWSPSETRD